jgi:hypothetical protein
MIFFGIIVALFISKYAVQVLFLLCFVIGCANLKASFKWAFLLRFRGSIEVLFALNTLCSTQKFIYHETTINSFFRIRIFCV